jgi:hypothetical protein
VTGRRLCDTYAMTRRPIYRWKSFRLGVLVLGLLGWLLLWGRTHSDLAVRLGKETWYGIVSSDGYLYGYIEVSSSGSFHARDFTFNSSTTRAEPRASQPLIVIVSRANPPTSVNSVGVAPWLLVLGFALPWTSFLAWRWRRMRRLGSSQHHSV